MNLILFNPTETEAPLPLEDRRAEHIVRHLKRAEGQSFDVGLIDGPRGKAWIARRLPDALVLEFRWESTAPPPLPAVLAVGAPRPQSARRILRDAAALGIGTIHFFHAAKGVPSYLESRLWTTGEYRRHLVEGAEQAFSTRLPEVLRHPDLAACIARLPADADRVALDPYEASVALPRHTVRGSDAVLAVGPERGWSAEERVLLRASGFTLANLGGRILRSDTACVAGITLILAQLGHF